MHGSETPNEPSVIAPPPTAADELGPTPTRRRLGDRPTRGRPSGRRVALVQFFLSSVALLIVVATIGAIVLRQVATGEALHDARSVTVAFGRGVLSNQITPAVLDGDPAAVAALDRAVRERVLGNQIVRIKVWTPGGRIVYSDAADLIGRSYALPDDLRAVHADNAVRADVTDLSRPENSFERGQGRLVEVYMPLRLASGERVLVEAYHPAGNVDAARNRIWREFVPVLFALLLALAAAQLPLAWSHTRRRRAEALEREQLAREAESALQAERGRIASELHDGVVQDLAGVAYELQAAAIQSPGATSGVELTGILHRGADVCRDSMTRLRDLLVDLRADDPGAQDLTAAIEALARPLRARGLEVAIDAQVGGALPRDTAEIIHRAARETLRTVHADARTVRIMLGADGSVVTLRVEDDGQSMAGEHRHAGRGPGHIALARLADSLAARGGYLSIDSEPGSGTRVTASVPRG
ncbi:MAG: two-component system, NarL family, sensor kinase [Solirubrobacteraceae bacterium]|jgi:signal transduction histidine kinase|nr:two-component system, NarL family, sensor kinase [Solirubrobacteraceae bacterium]MEA2290473.1 two-component system, NarL family, sensor kinase [Solirubrobacteraceae bacterium]